MTQSYTQKLDEYVARASAFRAALPDVAAVHDPLPAEVHKDGVLSGKIKRLMAVTAALCTGCEGCILFQSSQALELGATAEELLEAAAVAVSLGGTQAMSKTTWLVGYLQERGLMESIG